MNVSNRKLQVEQGQSLHIYFFSWVNDPVNTEWQLVATILWQISSQTRSIRSWLLKVVGKPAYLLTALKVPRFYICTLLLNKKSSTTNLLLRCRWIYEPCGQRSVPHVPRPVHPQLIPLLRQAVQLCSNMRGRLQSSENQHYPSSCTFW